MKWRSATNGSRPQTAPTFSLRPRIRSGRLSVPAASRKPHAFPQSEGVLQGHSSRATLLLKQSSHAGCAYRKPKPERNDIGTGCAAPHSLLAALETMEPGPADLEFVSFLTTSALPQVEGVSRTHCVSARGADYRQDSTSRRIRYTRHNGLLENESWRACRRTQASA